MKTLSKKIEVERKDCGKQWQNLNEELRKKQEKTVKGQEKKKNIKYFEALSKNLSKVFYLLFVLSLRVVIIFFFWLSGTPHL